MQSLRSRNNNKRRLRTSLAVLAAVLLLAGITTGGLYAMKLGPFQSDSTKNTADNNTKKDQSDESNTPVDIAEPKPTDPSSDSVKNPPESHEPDEANAGKLTITSAQINDSELTIRTLISDITQTGKCILVMSSSNGKQYSDVAGVQAVASASTCKGFDVPLSELGSGVWSITVTYSHNGMNSSATEEVVINA